MIDVLRFGFGKKELLKMTPEERGMFLLLRHLSNQVRSRRFHLPFLA
jgi:hypothetical protein